MKLDLTLKDLTLKDFDYMWHTACQWSTRCTEHLCIDQRREKYDPFQSPFGKIQRSKISESLCDPDMAGSQHLNSYWCDTFLDARFGALILTEHGYMADIYQDTAKCEGKDYWGFVIITDYISPGCDQSPT